MTLALKSPKVKDIPLLEHRTRNALARCSKLRHGGMAYLTEEKWNARKSYWLGEGEDGGDSNNKKEGYLKEELDWVAAEEYAREQQQSQGGDDDVDIPNPMAMMEGMKGQFGMMFQNMVMMQGIGYFFQGYVLVKVPIPLTLGFKGMFQRGLDLNSLETSYVSSISWYFLVMYGLRGFLKLVIERKKNSNPHDVSGPMGQEVMESTMIQADFGNKMMGNGMPSKYDANKAIKAEMEALEMTRYKGTIEDVERRLLGKKPKKKVNVGGSGANYDIFADSKKVSGAGASKLSKKKRGGKVKAN